MQKEIKSLKELEAKLLAGGRAVHTICYEHLDLCSDGCIYAEEQRRRLKHLAERNNTVADKHD